MTTRTQEGRRKPGPKGTVVQALCNECGNVRTCTNTFLGLSSNRPLRCKVCRTSTEHYRISADYSWDWREAKNAKQNEQNAILHRQLEASIAMLERLRIHFEYVESDEWMYRVWRERGRSSEHTFIQLADDLSLADQVTYLARAWTGLLPAAEHRWCTPWTIDEDDPEMEWRSFWWPRPPTAS